MIVDSHGQEFQLGDLVCWSASTRGSAQHTGIVVGFSKSGAPLVQERLDTRGRVRKAEEALSQAIRTPNRVNLTAAMRVMQKENIQFNLP